MFTTGFKLYGVLALVGLLAAFVQTFSVTNEFVGIWVYFGLTAAAGLVGGTVVYYRDAGTGTMVARQLRPVEAESVTANAPAVTPSTWPLIGALGIGLTAVGLVENAFITTIGLAVVAGTVVEWMVQGWSDRASADRRYNAGLRGRILHPLEFPVLGALVAGFVIYAFSRIMLAINVTVALVLFCVVGAVILVVAAVLARLKDLSKPVLIGVSVVGVGLFVAAAVTGIALGPVEHETDFVGNQRAVAMKSNTFGTVTMNGSELETLTVPKGTEIGILVVNESPEPSKLVVKGRRIVTDASGNSTLVVEEFASGELAKDKKGYVVFRMPRASDDKDFKYTYEQQVAGKAVAVGLIVVPS
jgi:hypothetical protein